MSEKTPVNNKRIILLRWIPAVALVLAMLIPSVAFPASAEIYDYEDYITKIAKDPANGENILVYVSLPLNVRWWVNDRTTGDSWTYTGKTAQHYVAQGHHYSMYCSPFGDVKAVPTSWAGDALDISALPASTKIEQIVYCDFNGGILLDGLSARAYYTDNLSVVSSNSSQYAYQQTGDGYVFTFSIPEGYDYFFTQQYFFDITASGSGDMVMDYKSSTLVISLNELYFEYQQNGSNKELVESIDKKLESQGQTIQGVLDAQQQTNDKLDELPGEIGDAVQDVIDKENEKHEQSGNSFVDQILDALPDPSTDVLAALKGLTDSTAYTGTEAKLTIPAIVLPGIGDLFPRTEIWGGAEFDFGEYVGLLPSSLLTLVQSLFTIAIVLFAVYELKDIISYCLTLRANKGG